jgi:hypothetical protein
MRVQFFEDPQRGPRPREDVRFNQLGLFVHEDGRRVAVGFDITPFLERPSIQVIVTSDSGQEAATFSIIEATQSNFNVTMHLRDKEPTELYTVEAYLFYPSPEEPRMVVDKATRTFYASRPGEQ